MDELKPCPFCGDETAMRLFYYNLFIRVKCDECGASSGYRKTEEEARQAWNMRKGKSSNE